MKTGEEISAFAIQPRLDSRILVRRSSKLSVKARFVAAILSGFMLSPGHGFSQTSVTTWHYNNQITGANTTEYTLNPSNVNSKSFGKLSTKPVDGYIVGHPLYLPGVTISGNGVHNVVYVATMHDSVYAFDADNTNTAPLWKTSVLTYSGAGATSVPATVTKDPGTTGWSELGIISTPVIDPASGTLYLVAETYENSKVVHRLHALDVTSGLEKLGGPVTIVATVTQNGKVTTFTDLFQINRPGLLLANGNIYLAFGSNGNNNYSQGWVFAYNAATLQQEGAYTAEPGRTLASIWQKGASLSSDSNGSIYFETGEGYFAAGTNLSISVAKLNQKGSALTLADWFAPYNQKYLSEHDMDLNDGVLILPDQPGAHPHEALAEGKEGTIYLLNRDDMGHFCSTCATKDPQIVQEIPQGAGVETGSPIYWNNTVYFNPTAGGVKAYSLVNGLLASPPLVTQKMAAGAHAMLTANGNTDGILWALNGRVMWALDAVTLKTLYNTSQAANGRDNIAAAAHFASPIAADGKVFLGAQSNLLTYGLLGQ